MTGAIIAAVAVAASVWMYFELRYAERDAEHFRTLYYQALSERQPRDYRTGRFMKKVAR